MPPNELLLVHLEALAINQMTQQKHNNEKYPQIDQETGTNLSQTSEPLI